MNVFAFAGNLTKDPELKHTTSGKAVANFSIAINEGKDKVLFLNCVAWEKTAELICEYCKKGDRLSGSGKIGIRSYEKDGEKKYATEIIVNQFDFPPKNNGGAAQSNNYESPTSKTHLQAENAHQIPDDFEDEIPF